MPDNGQGAHGAAESEENEVYGDFHKIILQGMIAAGCLGSKGVKTLFQSACKELRITGEEEAKKTSMMYVQKIVRGINEQIKPYDVAIKSATCELTSSKFFLFLPTIERVMWRSQVYFSKAELELFQLCLDGMMRKYHNFAMPSEECINLIRNVDSRTLVSQSEAFIKRLLDMSYFQKYFYRSTEYDITLGVRGLREFEPLLWDMYSDVIKTCQLCKNTLLQGYRCPKCKVLIHKHCFNKYVPPLPKQADKATINENIELYSKICMTNGCGFLWSASRDKDMLRRYRETDLIIETEGPDVELRGYKPSREPSESWVPRERLRRDEVTEEDNEMPSLEPQVSRLKKMTI